MSTKPELSAIKNILFVSLDGLRVDVAYSGKFNCLNRCKERGISFSRVVASAPLTPISHASILSGLQPARHGVRHLFLEQILPEVTLLPELLQSQGWTTQGIVSCPGLNSWYGFSRGFDHYDDRVPNPPGGDALNTVDVKMRGLAAKEATEVREKAIAAMDRFREKNFLFVHFFDAHWPYDPPKEYLGKTLSNPYEGEVCYMDTELGKILDEFDRRGLTDSTLIVIFGDHGEDLGGWYGNDHAGEKLGHPEEEGHGALLYDTTLLVPLIFIFPDGWNSGHSIENQVRLVDITPTLVSIFGLAHTTCFDGTSLMPHMNGAGRSLLGQSETNYPRESEALVRTFPNLRNLRSLRLVGDDHEYKVIWQIDGDGLEVFDLRNDPGERTNLAGGTGKGK